MSITTEQQVIDIFWPDNNTKTIEDLITAFSDGFNCSRESAISHIKDNVKFVDVTDWSI